MYLDRLKLIQDRCIGSPFFSSHELIGSSLLFVHDDTKVTKNFTNIFIMMRRVKIPIQAIFGVWKTNWLRIFKSQPDHHIICRQVSGWLTSRRRTRRRRASTRPRETTATWLGLSLPLICFPTSFFPTHRVNELTKGEGTDKIWTKLDKDNLTTDQILFLIRPPFLPWKEQKVKIETWVREHIQEWTWNQPNRGFMWAPPKIMWSSI